jgi:PhnB protein
MEGEHQTSATRFAPMLYMKNVADAIEFYKKAFDAEELQRWSNDDGSVHVAEMSIEGAMFHMHEEVTRNNELSPGTLNGTSVELGLFVPDPHAVAAKAITAGATETNPVQDYDYGYQQGSFVDPFGHHWTVQKKIV